MLLLGQKYRQNARVELRLPLGAAREQFLAARFELQVQFGNEPERLRREDLRELERHRPGDRNALRKRVGHVHRTILGIEISHRNMKAYCVADCSEKRSGVVSFPVVRVHISHYETSL